MSSSAPICEDIESPGSDAQNHCPLCGQNESNLRFQDGPIRVQDCKACGVTYVSPRRSAPELIEQVYDQDYWLSPHPRLRGYANYAGERELHRRTFQRRWDALQAHLPSAGKALDVGCATGDFLELLDGYGWEVHGIEPSACMARLAAERLGQSRVQCSTLEDAQLETQQFDLITLWDVLEHLPDPLRALQIARKHLAPGGRLVIETQDISAPMARLCGRRWQHFKHDEHLLHFTPKSLQAACERAGLSFVHLQRRGAGKYVRGKFLVERSARLHASLPKLLGPLLGGDWAVYVNPGDEVIVILEAAQ